MTKMRVACVTAEDSKFNVGQVQFEVFRGALGRSGNLSVLPHLKNAMVTHTYLIGGCEKSMN